MSAIPGLACPECGHDARVVRRLHRTRRRYWRAAAGLLLVLIGPVMAAGVLPILDRLVPFLPARSWVVILPAFSEEARAAYHSRAVRRRSSHRESTNS
jgi:hypothetical protein